RKLTPEWVKSVGNIQEWLGTSDSLASVANGKPYFLEISDDMFMPRTNTSGSLASVSIVKGKACTTKRLFFKADSIFVLMAGSLWSIICFIGQLGTVQTNCFSGALSLLLSIISKALSIMDVLYCCTTASA